MWLGATKGIQMTFLFDTVPIYLTLDEGAEFLSQTLGYRVTPRNILALAENHQFGLFAGLDEKPPFISKTKIKHPSPSSCDGFYMYPLSTSNIQELSAQGHTLITAIMVFATQGKDAGKESIGWEIDPDYPPPKVELADCRVSREHLDKWIDLNQLRNQSPNESQHVNNILTVLDELGLDRNAIPRGGRKTAEAECLKRFNMSASVFKKNWSKASTAGLLRIADREKYLPR